MQGMAEGLGDTAMLDGNQEMFGCTASATGAHQNVQGRQIAKTTFSDNDYIELNVYNLFYWVVPRFSARTPVLWSLGFSKPAQHIDV